MIERKLNGKPFQIKSGKEREYAEFINKAEGKKIVDEKSGITKEALDPLAVILTIGGVAWAISRAVKIELEQKYIEYE